MGVGGVVVCGPLHIGRRGARAEDGHPVDAARSVPTPPGTGMGRRLSAIPRCARLGGESAESARPEARLRSEKRLRRLRPARRAAGTARATGRGALSGWAVVILCMGKGLWAGLGLRPLIKRLSGALTSERPDA